MIDPKYAVVTNKVGDVIDAALAIPVTVNVPALAVIDPAATKDELPVSVMLEELVMPLTVIIPALAVIDPATTMDVLKVTVVALVIP